MSDLRKKYDEPGEDSLRESIKNIVSHWVSEMDKKDGEGCRTFNIIDGLSRGMHQFGRVVVNDMTDEEIRVVGRMATLGFQVVMEAWLSSKE